MARFAVSGSQNASTAAPFTIISVGNGAALTFMINVFEIDLGPVVTTPADSTLQYTVARCSAMGTSTAVTEIPLDGGLAAAAVVSQMDCGQNHTVEPTADGIAFLEFGLNQRATWRWVATPGAELGAKPAKSNGIYLTIVESEAGAPEISASMHWIE